MLETVTNFVDSNENDTNKVDKNQTEVEELKHSKTPYVTNEFEGKKSNWEKPPQNHMKTKKA